MGKTRFRSEKAQASLEYIMMLSAVSIIIVIALAMMVQLKDVAIHAFGTYAGNKSIAYSLSNALENLSAS